MQRITLVALLLAQIVARPALADKSRRIAVLEYRAGVRTAVGIGERIATQLTRLTSNKVISPSDARRRLGPKLDAYVARCKGDAGCIARLAGKLFCDEVLLVGVSQLGDTILVIQRIEVHSGQVLSRMADTVSRRQRVPRSTVNRYLRKLLPPDDFKRYGRIVVRTEAVGDKVLLDEVLRGTTPIAPLKVPAPGRYTIRVRRPGYVDFVARLDVLPDASVQVRPTLSPKGRVVRLKWYQRWWVWAIIGGVVAGGATTAAVLSASRSPDSVSAVVRWP